MIARYRLELGVRVEEIIAIEVGLVRDLSVGIQVVDAEQLELEPVVRVTAVQPNEGQPFVATARTSGVTVPKTS